MERRILRILAPSVNQQREQFKYAYENDEDTRPITDARVLERIRAMHIPPRYTDVVIYPRENDKIQAFGFDAKGRKQTMYAKWFVEQQSVIKFDRVLRLKRIMPRIQADVNRTLKEAVDALQHKKKKYIVTNQVQVRMVVKLMMLCNFRIGNSVNATKYKSYGLTTILWRHITFDEHASKVTFSFIGKKGVLNEAVCTDQRIVKLLQHMRDVNNHDNDIMLKKLVFSISASQVNNYLKTFSQLDGEDISSKDLRTWQANALFVKYFKKNKNKGKEETMSLKKRQTDALKRVAEALHNTPAVCKRSYIYPEFLMRT